MKKFEPGVHVFSYCPTVGASGRTFVSCWKFGLPVEEIYEDPELVYFFLKLRFNDLTRHLESF